MSTIVFTAHVAINGRPHEGAHTYSKTMDPGFVANDLALLRLAGEVADLYADQGAVAVSDLTIIDAAAFDHPVPPISLNSPL